MFQENAFSLWQHPRWVETIQFVSYQPPPADLTDKGQYEEWCERLKFIGDDLHWLLQLRHDKFWCQVKVANFLVLSYVHV